MAFPGPKDRSHRADLHIHTCLSPCADLGMSPRSIAVRSKEKGLDIIAVCDHNSAENVIAVRRAAERVNIEVIGGMEITTSEEVHILALFDKYEDNALLSLQEIVYENLQGEGGWKHAGEQVLANEDDEVVGLNNRPLVSATRIPLEKTVDIIHSLHGLAIAAHIDRQGFGIFGQLGFIPKGLPLDAVEISPNTSYREAREKFSVPYPFIASSDAHFLEDIGKASTVFSSLKHATIQDIKECLARTSLL